MRKPRRYINRGKIGQKLNRREINAPKQKAKQKTLLVEKSLLFSRKCEKRETLNRHQAEK